MLRRAVNITDANSWNIARRLLSASHIDFVELLIDNFLHIDPKRLSEELIDIPVAFHVMQSRFIETPQTELDVFLKRLSDFVECLNPIYVSDHVLKFTYQGVELASLEEIDYSTEYKRVCDRLNRYQDSIQQRIHLENYPSLRKGGLEQADFFYRLTKETDCGVLFDLSNAFIAEKNVGARFDSWKKCRLSIKHGHIGSFQVHGTQDPVLLDTHDGDLNDHCLKRVGSASWLNSLVSIVVEKDQGQEEQRWVNSILQTQEALQYA